jgi:hypothetical protein
MEAKTGFFGRNVDTVPKPVVAQPGLVTVAIGAEHDARWWTVTCRDWQAACPVAARRANETTPPKRGCRTLRLSAAGFDADQSVPSRPGVASSGSLFGSPAVASDGSELVDLGSLFSTS